MRRLLALVAAAAALASTATPVLGLLLWTLTVTPSSAVTGTETTFTLTATNADLLTELGCLEVDLPASFSILGASAGTASNGDRWEAVVFNNNKVAVHSLSGGGRLATLEHITFTIRATPTAAGEWLWSNHAHPREDCAGTDELGTPLSILVVDPVTLLPSPTPTPAPIPTPTPAPILALPTLPPLLLVPEPTDRLVRPSPSPTSAAAADPTPTASFTAAPSPAATPRSTPSGASAQSDGSSGTGSDPGAGEAGTAALTVARVEDAAAEPAEVSLGPLGVIDGLTVWAIPGAAIGGPGLLVILWVALQASAAAVWIPAVRRLRGRDEGRRPPPTPAAS